MSSLQCLRICRSCLVRTAGLSPGTGPAGLFPPGPGDRTLPRGHRPLGTLGAPPRRQPTPKRGNGAPAPPDEKPNDYGTAARAEERQTEPGCSPEVEEYLSDERLQEVVSEFARLRRQAFEEDRRSKDPVYKESYPRLRHRGRHMSVPSFRKLCMDSENLDQPSENITVYGRVRTKRKHGSRLLFLDVVNEFERLQGMINFKKCAVGSPDLTLEKFKMFMRLIEAGDHISITGRPTRTQTGELTIEAAMLPELLAPATEQIPAKLVEHRMHRRHVDLLVNREAADILRLKAHITQYMRDYFHGRRFLEYQTPILAERAGGAAARPFTTASTELSSRELMLRIAPELWLKRLVIGGVDKVFEIGPVFRNEGIDADHNPEFTMCEFYSSYTNLEDLIGQTEELICGIARRCHDLIAAELKALPPLDLDRFSSRPFRRVEFVPALEAALGFRLPKLTGKAVFPEMLAMLRLAGIEIPGGDVPPTMAKLLDRLSAVYVEPLSFAEPVFVTHYPACMSPLAKSFACPGTFQLVSARAELFVNGREIANMYEEENDPEEQLRKLRAHRDMINTPEGIGFAGDDGDAEPLDHNYVRSMRAGLPPTGGWGCGVERLVMLFSGASRISDCFSFGSLRNVVSMSAEERANMQRSSPER